MGQGREENATTHGCSEKTWLWVISMSLSWGDGYSLDLWEVGEPLKQVHRELLQYLRVQWECTGSSPEGARISSHWCNGVDHVQSRPKMDLWWFRTPCKACQLSHGRDGCCQTCGACACPSTCQGREERNEEFYISASCVREDIAW